MGFIDAYESFGLDSSKAKCLWTFDEFGSHIITSTGDGSGIFAETPNSNFDSVSGRGFWSGDRVLIDNTDNLDVWEVFMVFDREESKTDIILSTRNYITGAGISFGVNDANVPFVYTNLRNEVVSRTFDSIHLTKINAICLSKGVSDVTLSVYNPSGGWVESETKSFPSQAFGNNEIFVGMDYQLTGELPDSPFVGNIYELALYSDGLVNTVRNSLLNQSFSGYTGAGVFDGFVTTNTGEVTGVGLGEMVSFEKANKVAVLSRASNKFYIPETGDFNHARIFKDGVLDTDEYSLYGNGVILFDSELPSEVIYDIYITGSSVEGDMVTGTGYALVQRPKNSFYVKNESGRMRRGVDFFESSSLDLFHGKQMGASSPSSSNLMVSI